MERLRFFPLGSDLLPFMPSARGFTTARSSCWRSFEGSTLFWVVGNDPSLRKFAELPGLGPDDSRFVSNLDRVTNKRLLAGMIDESLP